MGSLDLEDRLRGMILTNIGQPSLPSPSRNNYPGPHAPHGLNNPGSYPSDYSEPRGPRPFRGQDHYHRPNHHPRQFPHDTRGGHYQFNHRGGPSMRGTHHPPSGYHPNQPYRHKFDPPDFVRGSRGGMQPRQPRQLYNPQSHAFSPASGPQFESQWNYLENLISQEVPLVEMSPDEVASKDSFRLHLEKICQGLKDKYPDKDIPSVTLECFGSLSSGFASAGSDMDLAIVTDSADSTEQHHLSLNENSLPRVLEKELLDQGLGARLLTRTRVPIIKICETPTRELIDALQEERQKWNALPDEEKYGSLTAPSNEKATLPKDDASALEAENAGDIEKSAQTIPEYSGVASDLPSSEATETKDEVPGNPQETNTSQTGAPHAARQRGGKQWTRERLVGPLDFPKDGVGIQCDINFFNPLGLYNTKLLRCYSRCDHRVRPMVLFVKAWAKRRKVNSSYSGTLSSYGYVLMVLHYLINVAQPPVLPNLQLQAARAGLPAKTIDGWEVRFLDNEEELVASASRGLLTQNRDPLGVILRGFFQYFASTSGGQGFIWMQDVLSLRTPGGLMKKEEKGWTGAKTEVGDNQKEVRHRYLFAIEDPFELTHNVARTVTHNGIVAIRDEFRRAWRIIQAVGRGMAPRDGELFAELEEATAPVSTAQPKAEATEPVQTSQATTFTRVDNYNQAFPQLGPSPKVQPVVQNSGSTGQSRRSIPPGRGPYPGPPDGNHQYNQRRSMNDEGFASRERTQAHPQVFRRQQQVTGRYDNGPNFTEARQ